MKSVTKSHITPAQVKALTVLQFPEAQELRIRELTAGAFNTAYLVEGEGLPEKGAVLKIGPAPGTEILTYEKDIIQTEVQVYGLLKDRPIPTPELYAHDFSGEAIPNHYFFMEHLEGGTWSELKRNLPKESRPALMRELGRCNAAIHSVEGAWFGYIKDDTRFQFDSWSKAFTAMVNDILNDGRERGYRLPYTEIEGILLRYRDVLDEIRTPKLVDFDMWAGNVFLEQTDAFHIAGVVDLERSFYGDPYADFISAMMLFSDVEKEPDFQEGYAQISGVPLSFGENDRARMTLYRLYLALIMLVETYRYGKAYAAGMRLYTKNRINKYIRELK